MPIFAGLIVVPVNALTGVGGPILDVFFQRVSLTRHQVVATKAVIQALAHTTKIIYFGVLVGGTAKLAHCAIIVLRFITCIGRHLRRKACVR